jgi:hypothetical protein
MARQKKPFDAVQFTRESAERVARVVRQAELTPAAASPLTFRKVTPADTKKTIRMATFTGAWPIGGNKNVTFKYVTDTPNTAMVTNLVCGLNPAASCDVSIARDGTSWFLLQPNFTQLPGYSATGTQVLAIVSGNLIFVGTTSCSTAA